MSCSSVQRISGNKKQKLAVTQIYVYRGIYDYPKEFIKIFIHSFINVLLCELMLITYIRMR